MESGFALDGNWWVVSPSTWSWAMSLLLYFLLLILLVGVNEHPCGTLLSAELKPQLCSSSVYWETLHIANSFCLKEYFVWEDKCIFKQLYRNTLTSTPPHRNSQSVDLLQSLAHHLLKKEGGDRMLPCTLRSGIHHGSIKQGQKERMNAAFTPLDLCQSGNSLCKSEALQESRGENTQAPQYSHLLPGSCLTGQINSLSAFWLSSGAVLAHAGLKLFVGLP